MRKVIDAEYYQAEDWAKDPELYSEHCARVRKRKDRKYTAFVQRLLVGSLAFFGLVIAAVLLVV